MNVFRLETIPKVLEDIHALTRRAYDARSKCKKRRELISYFNLAPDAIDRFLLQFGVGKVAVLDADASPDERFPAFYDVPNSKPLAALSRPLKKCRRVWEGYRLDHPLVRATLGASIDAINQRRFRADAFVVSDLYEYCRQRIAERIVDVLEKHLTNRLFTCGLQQPPLTLAAANFTQLHRHYDLERVDGVSVKACDSNEAVAEREARPVVRTCQLKTLPGVDSHDSRILPLFLNYLKQPEAILSRHYGAPGCGRMLDRPWARSSAKF